MDRFEENYFNPENQMKYNLHSSMDRFEGWNGLHDEIVKFKFTFQYG